MSHMIDSGSMKYRRGASNKGLETAMCRYLQSLIAKANAPTKTLPKGKDKSRTKQTKGRYLGLIISIRSV